MKYINAGAGKTVTGSCHYLELGNQTLLVDCGMFQGRQESRNRKGFPFAPHSLDAVLVTHGHLDHIGRLPLLVKQGYEGPIYATEATIEIARVTLLDAAHIQLEDYKRDLRRARRAGQESKVEIPLFDREDAEKILAAFEPVSFDAPLALGNVKATYMPAGHILGSAFIVLENSDGRVIFSGDLGNRESSLQQDATLPPEADVVFVETTYASRKHRSTAATQAEFFTVLDQAMARGGNVMIPSFALERTQIILHQIKEWQETRPKTLAEHVFLDSPMAITMTDFYRECANEFIAPIKEELEIGAEPFTPEHLSCTRSANESKTINEIDGGAIIIAGSGMMTGGRIIHHLKHNLWRAEASLIVVGYQAEGTLGRRIIDSVNDPDAKVRLFGDDIIVRASVHTIGGFSAHADQDDLLSWLEPTKASQVVLVHGEEKVMEQFRKILEPQNKIINMPYVGEFIVF